MRLVPINCVKEESYLAKTIYDASGTVLLAQGSRLNAERLKAIERNGILSIYINDEYSDNDIEDIIKPEIRQKAIKAVKDSFESIAKFSAKENSQRVSNNKRKNRKVIYNGIEDLFRIIDEIVEEILLKNDILINLVDIKSMDNYTYEHSVNVTVLSLILGIELGFPKHRLYDLAIGAMLHDVGKVYVPKEILQKKGKLTPQEYEIMKGHPKNGYEYLKNNIFVSSTARIIALQHHERIDGLGYPNHIKGDRINELSKVVSVADVYDALTSDRAYRSALPSNEAVEYIMGGASRYFDFDVVKAFMRRVVPYPEGTAVKLSNGDIAIVDKLCYGFPLHPVVKVIRRNNKDVEPIFIDLLKENDIVITSIQYEL